MKNNCLNCIHLKKDKNTYPIHVIYDLFYCITLNNIIHSTRKLMFNNKFLKHFKCNFHRIRKHNESQDN